MNLASFSVKRPVTTTMIFIGLVGLGIFSLSKVGQELFPDIALPTVLVYTVSPGVGPYDVESSITKPIEGAVSSLSGLDGIESTSSEGLSRVTVRFTQGTKMDRALTDIREAINTVEDKFPDGTIKSRLILFTAGMLPTLRVNIYTQTQGMDLRGLLEDKVLPELERIPGVAQASLIGGGQSAVLVELQSDSLKNLGVSIPGIIQSFGGDNVNLPGGTLRLSDRNLTVRTVGNFKTPEDIGDIVVGSNGDQVVYLKNVAKIEMTDLPQEEFVYTKGKEGIRLNIQKQPGYNTVSVNEAVIAKLNDLRSELPPSTQIETVEDQAHQVKDAIGGVAEAAYVGGLLAVLVLIFFLRNIRSTLIITVTLPISVITTFVLINVGGLTLNISSLLGITLAVGNLVDNAIVVLESIYRKMLIGQDAKTAAVKGTNEVASAITASTLANMSVFIPMLFVDGLAGVLFRDLALTITFSHLVSLIASLTIVPMLCSRTLRVRPLNKFLDQNGKPIQRIADDESNTIEDVSLADVDVRTGNRILDTIAAWIKKALQGMDNDYVKIINWALGHLRIVLVSAVLLLVASVGLVFLMGTEFLPETDDGRFTVNIETRTGATYEQTSAKATEVERIVTDIAGPYISSISSVVGEGGSNIAETNVTLVPKNERPMRIWDLVRQVDTAITDKVLDIKHTTDIEGMAALATQSSGIAAPIVISMSGEDIDRMYAYATKLKNEIEKVPGTRNVRISHKLGKPELVLRIKRQEAVSLGLSPMQIAATVRAAYSGYSVSTFTQGDKDYDIRLILQNSDRNNVDKLKSLFFMNSRGDKINIETVVNISEETGPVSISRVDRARVIDVMSDLSGTETLNTVSSGVSARVAALGDPPVGVTIKQSGSGAEMLSSFRSLAIALLVAILLVYMVMAAQFENLLNPFIIMFSIPFAVIGLILALLITNTTFNILSFTGAILLAGVVVNNAIVLLDYINILRKRGVDLRTAITHGGKTRLKPIIMSSATTILGLLPLALGFGAGAELQAPIARAVIGGLTTSTVITLVIVPCILWWIETRLRKNKISAVETGTKEPKSEFTSIPVSAASIQAPQATLATEKLIK